MTDHDPTATDAEQPTADAPDAPDASNWSYSTAATEERRMVPAAAFVAAVMVAAVLGILAVVALTAGGDAGSDDNARAARLAAGRFGERFLTFDHEDLDQWKADVLELSTGGFAGEVEEVESGLRRLIGESELDASTQVTDIFLGEVDRGSVSAVLIYDRSITGARNRTESDRYMQLELIQVDGVWLVDEVIDIATAGALGAVSGPPTDTTETTENGEG